VSIGIGTGPLIGIQKGPEDLREVMSAYQRCVAETVQRFRGFVAKYMGDGVLVYFGYPQAHEHDAERAVRAGLEVVQAVVVGKSVNQEIDRILRQRKFQPLRARECAMG
jgi:class 3 adenylate cyclase